MSVPESISFTDAVVICDAGITARHAVDRSELKLGESVVILGVGGVGGVGSYAVQFAKLAGSRVIGLEVTEAKTAHGRALGADEAVNTSAQNAVDEILRFTDGLGVDCVIDIVDKEAMIGTLRNGDRIVIVGYTSEEYRLSGRRIAQNELKIIGTRCGRKQDLINTVRLVAEGSLKPIVTDQYSFEQINEAMTKLRTGEVLGRLVLQMPKN